MFAGLLTACSEGVVLPSAPVGDGPGTLMGGGGQGGGDIPVDPGDITPMELPGHDSGFKAVHFSGSGQCASCHDDLSDDAEEDISIVSGWAGSMMANAARDPYWIAKVAAEIHRNPALENTLDDNCSRCHAPMANDAARKSGVVISILGDQGILNSNNPLFSHAMEGVSCTLCHQIEDNGLLGTVEGVSGNFSIREYAQRSQRPAYGQYSDPNGVYMQAQTQFNPSYGAHVSTAGLCAACHDLRTPGGGHSLSTGDGNAASKPFPEQMVFSEWQHSRYALDGQSGQTCQSCHMPEISGAAMLATEGGGVAREGFSKHSFLGANTVMQQLMLNYRGELGLNAGAWQIAESIDRNRAFLKGSATIRISSTQLDEQTLTVNLNINNKTGHKLPSGYPSRRVYIHFLVVDATGAVVFESGKLNADGSVIGLDGDVDPEQYERHHQLVESEDQVQVYESVMANSGEGVTHTLMEATDYLKDNRLLPIGFNKLTAPDDIRVAGEAVSDESFVGGGDSVTYRLDVGQLQETTIVAELVYQPLAYSHLRDLFSSSQVREVKQFKLMFEASSLKAEVIDSHSVTLP